MLAHGLNNILIPSRLSAEGVTADNIGLIMSMFAVGVLLGGKYSRRLIIRVGHIRVYAASAAVAAIAILCCYLWMNVWLWAIMRLLIGFSIATVNVVSDGWLSERATNTTRARILAINQVILLSAMFFGSLMINLADIGEPTLYILVGMLFCGGVIPIAISRIAAPEVKDSPSMPVLKLFNLSPVGVMSVFACGVMLSIVLSMLVVYAESKGITGFNASLLVGAAIMGGFLMQYPVGYLADKFDRRTVLFNIVIISMLCNLLIPFIIDQNVFTIVLFLVALSSGIIASFYPLGLAESFDRLVQSEMGSAIGTMVMIYALGGMVGPYVTGLFMELLGSDYFFFFLVAIHGAFGLFIIYRSRIRSSIPLDQQEQFVPQEASGWVSTDLDPRIEYEVQTKPLSEVAQTIVTMAENRPELALEMVCLVAKSMPNQLEEVVGAVASVEGVDGVKIYNLLQEFAPEQQQDLASTLVAASPEQSGELVTAIFDDADNKDIPELAANLTDVAPEQSLEIIEAATDAVMDDNPDAVVEIAEAYLNQVTDNLDEMRYADRLADESNKTVTEMVSMIAEKAPEQAVDVAVVAVEAIPESASDMVDALTESSSFEGEIVSGLDEKPISDKT